MITNLQYLSIYEKAIDWAISAAEEAIKRVGLGDQGVQDLNEMALDELKESGDWDNITNSIIRAYFIVAYDMIKQTNPKIECSYYVNCYDSHFYMNGKEVIP